MGLTTTQFGEHGKSAPTVDVVLREDTQCHQHLVGVQTGVLASQVFGLRLLYGFDEVLRYEFQPVVDACQVFRGVEQQGGTCAEQRTAGGGDEGAVVEFDGAAGHVALFPSRLGGFGASAVVGGDLRLLHEQGEFVDFGFVDGAFRQLVEGGVVASDDFLFRGFAAGFVVGDAESHHVDPHVGGRLVGAVSVDAFEDGVEDGEYLYVAVIVDGDFAVGFHVEGVDHVHVVEVGCCCLVGDVDGVLEGQTPNGERLELGVSGFCAALVFVVELAQADCHLTAAGTWSSDDDQRMGGLDKVILSESVVGVDECHVVGIALDGVMVIDLDAHVFEALAIEVGRLLSVVVGDDNAADVESAVDELGAQSQYVLVIGDAEILSDLVLLDVEGTDDDEYLGVAGQLLQHVQFAVGLEAW